MKTVLLKKNLIPGTFKHQLLFLCIISFLLYFNTFTNQYALDDGIIIEKNEFVKKGFDGINDIMTKDAFYSFYKQMNASTDQLSGGRYRPLSIVTFAIETEFFGESALPRHIFNVLFYVLSIGLIFYLFRKYFFVNLPDIAFIAAFIFAIHPLHTEVIANAKSRDEIFSMLFITLTFIFAYKYYITEKFYNLGLMVISYFAALLSKEYAVTIVGFVPLSIYLLKDNLPKFKLSKLYVLVFSLLSIVVFYILLRISFVGATGVESSDVFNNPYLYATDLEKLATKIFILLKYIILLFVPYPLSADYSYSQIAYRDFYDLEVWASIIIYLSLMFFTVKLFIKKHFLAFAFAFYLVHLAMVTNFFFIIGATMGERLVYHSSLGFSIAIAYLIIYLINRTKSDNYKTKQIYAISILSIILILSAIIIIPRNKQWENTHSLFIHDVEVVPNSALANGNAAVGYITYSEQDKSKEDFYLNKAIKHLEKAISIHNRYGTGYLNLGYIYFKQQKNDLAKINWDNAKQIYRMHPLLPVYYNLLSNSYLSEAFVYGQKKDFKKAEELILKAIDADSTNPDCYYHYGGYFFTIQKYDMALKMWEKTLKIKPDHKLALEGYRALKK